jgi:hypothetical protein
LSTEPQAPTAYRTAPLPRMLVVHLGYAWKTTLVSVLLGLVFLAGAGETWLSHSTVGVRRHTWVPAAGCVPQAAETHETEPLSTKNLLEYVHGTGSWDRRVVALEMPIRKASLFLLVMAVVAFLGPQLMTERATVTLDEREGKMRLARRRFGMTDRAQRPLGELKEAVLVQRGWETSAQLVFAGGERLDLAAPTNGDAGHAKLVKLVNEFTACQARRA